MAWYKDLIQKLNPAQQAIADDEGTNIQTDSNLTFIQAFDKVEAVNRGVSMIVRACSSLDFDVKEKIIEGVVGDTRQKTLLRLLNHRPNPYQPIQEFRNNMYTDFLLEGNVFLYYDGAFLYHLPARFVEIETDPITFVKGYKYDGRVSFKPNEVLHFKDLSNNSIYRGSSRLLSCTENINSLYNMQRFQKTFFDNGAVPGMVFTTENTLSTAAKERTIKYWVQRYNPRSGSRAPMIVDSGLKPVPITNTSFKELDFETSIVSHRNKILNALGIPVVLFDGGNNANISPNLRLFYLETVLPITRSFVSAIERYFGYDVEPVTSGVSALQPELRELSAYLVSLVNGGVITPNEAREHLRFAKIEGQDTIRVPANIAGSAVDPSQGGAPKQPD